MGYMEKLKTASCKEGELLLMWMGQAGFVLKNSAGKILAIDVYLSDLAMRQDGNKRLTSALVTAEELKTDVILASHSHTDHLDLDSLPIMLREDTRLFCTKDCYRLCQEAGLPMEKVQSIWEGSHFEEQGYRVDAVYADHGDTSPDAVGFLIESEGIRVYFTGDTSYQCERMKSACARKIDLLLTPINGEYGNMNENDAAMLAELSDAVLTLPCHFWTFARHQGSPFLFEAAMRMLAPEKTGYVMAQGEIIRYGKNQTWETVL